jgi:arylsulfatase A-like enzyme
MKIKIKPIALIILSVLLLVLLFTPSNISSDADIVLLIAVEEINPSHMNCYGYERHITPNIDELAKTGVLFSKYYSQAADTETNFISMITGFHAGTASVNPDGAEIINNLPSVVTVFKQNGYSPAVFTADERLALPFSQKAGLDHLYSRKSTTPDKSYIDSKTLTDNVLKYLKTDKEKKKFILIVFSDTREPFNPPAPFNTLFSPIPPGTSEEITEIRIEMNEDIHNLKRNLYDSELAFIDFQVGRLVEYFEDSNSLDRSLIIFTGINSSWGGVENRKSPVGLLNNGMLQIPLIISGNGIPEKTRPEEIAQQIDLLPTITDLLRINNLNVLPGESLLVAIRDPEKTTDKIIYHESLKPGLKRIALQDSEWKEIYDIERKVSSLFNLKKDPGETKNLVYAFSNPGSEKNGNKNIFIDYRNKIKDIFPLISKTRENIQGNNWNSAEDLVKQIRKELNYE